MVRTRQLHGERDGETSAMKRTPMKPGQPPSRKTPLKAQNRARRSRLFREHFGSKERVRFVRQLPCTVCGRTPSENAHVRSKAAGGKAEDIAPLCSDCHARQHRIGIESFQALHGIDLRAAARRTDAAWLAHTNKEG